MTHPEGATPRRRRFFRPTCEHLEARAVPATFRSIDGTGNNLSNPDWGTAGSTLLRTAPAAYGDGVSTPGGATRPSARAVSNAVSAEAEETLSSRDLSALVYAFGQFVDHDLSLTEPGTPRESFPIPVPAGDPFFDPAGTGVRTIGLSRSQFDPATGTGPGNPRQQVNQITAYLDGSVVYGSDPVRAAALRTFSGGRLRTGAGDLMPPNTVGLPNENRGPLPGDQLFLGGDIRANENIELTAVHVLFLREHNRLADEIAAANPGLGDEEIYQRARRIVGAELQAIVYNEWLPALLGPDALRPYTGYSPATNPGIANEFSTAALRIGHTLLGDDVEFLDDEAEEVREEVPLSGAFFNPGLVREAGIDPILKYLATDPAREVDPVVVGSVRNFLFGPPGAGGFDLASLNIQRGRDHGLADYNTLRAAYGLPRVTDFSDITSDPELQGRLRELYGSVDDIDPWVGGLAEDRAPGSSVGPLFRRVIADQFERVRDGDRFWYQREFGGAELAAIEGTTVADLVRRNTSLTNIQENLFFFDPTITGTVFRDQDGDGLRDAGEGGLAGQTVRLVDADDGVVAEATTAADGTFRFAPLDGPGGYRVALVVGPGLTATAGGSAEVHVARGGTFDGFDFGVRSSQIVDPIGEPPVPVVPPVGPPPPVPPVGGGGDPGPVRPEVFVVGAGVGSAPTVTVYDARTGLPKTEFMAFDGSFQGGVRVAAGDLTGDGVPDVVAGAGEGGGPRVRAFDGATGAVLFDRFAFEPEFRGGVAVAVGDVNGDGFADVAVGAGAGGPRVCVFSGKDGSVLADFFAFDAGHAGGVSVAVGNFDADPALELAVGSGGADGPEVRTFDVVGGGVVPLGGFPAFEADFRGGLWLAAGDTDGDGLAELIVGAGDGGGPRVRVLDRDGAVVSDYFAADPDGRDGVRVAAADADGDGKAEVIVGSGGRLRVVADDVFPDDIALGHGAFVGGG